jgi:hypothetical protein
MTHHEISIVERMTNKEGSGKGSAGRNICTSEETSTTEKVTY